MADPWDQFKDAPDDPYAQFKDAPAPAPAKKAYTEMPPTSPGAEAFTLSPQQQDLGEASMRGMAGGATFGMYNRGAGLYDYATGAAPSYSEGVDRLARREQELAQKHPIAHGIGTLIGGAATGTGLARSGVTLVNPTMALLPRVGTAAVEGAGYGALAGAGNTYSEKPSDYLWNAGKGGAAGAVVGGAATAAGAGASAAYNYFRDRTTGLPLPIVRAGRADDEGLRDMRQLGPAAMLPDAGPSMKGVTQGAVQGTGENRTAITRALTDRENATVPRMRADVEAAIGPPPPSNRAIEQHIDEARQQINAREYPPRLQGRQIPQNEADDLITELRRIGTEGRENLGTAIRDLHAPNTHGTPQARGDTDPQTLLTVRRKLSTMIDNAVNSDEPNLPRARVLGQARDRVNTLLETHVPDIREADAIFAANRRELESLRAGANVFDKGKNAIDPRDLLEDIRTSAVPGPHAPPGPTRAPQRLRQGAAADIYRRLGTESDDLRALEKTLGGQRDWAGEKSEHVFGQQPAADVAETVRRNRVFRDTYSDVLKGSKTGQMLASRQDAGFAPTDLKNTTLTGLALRGAEKTMDALRLAGVQRQREEVARILALRDPAEVARLRELLIAHNAGTIPQSRAISQGARGAFQGGVNALVNQPTRLEIDTSKWR